MIKVFLIALIFIAGLIYWNLSDQTNSENNNYSNPSLSDTTKKQGAQMSDKIIKSDEEWKKELTPEEYRILREKGTERAFTGKYWDHHELGTYICAACSTELFE